LQRVFVNLAFRGSRDHTTSSAQSGPCGGCPSS
jgi:hypothetical protein